MISKNFIIFALIASFFFIGYMFQNYLMSITVGAILAIATRGHNRKRKLLYGRSHLSSKSSKILNVKNPRFLHSI